MRHLGNFSGSLRCWVFELLLFSDKWIFLGTGSSERTPSPENSLGSCFGGNGLVVEGNSLSSC
jgi:hypothetical protein